MKKIKNNYSASPYVMWLECKPTKRERVKAVFRWVWHVIKHPRFASSLLLLWGFFGVIVMMYCNFPPVDQKITGAWTIVKLIFVVTIPTALSLRAFILIEDAYD